jgi:hypothetical protein
MTGADDDPDLPAKAELDLAELIEAMDPNITWDGDRWWYWTGSRWVRVWEETEQ